MKGTRVAILQDLEAWAMDTDAPHIFWLSGMAGTGKSSIARSFAHILKEGGRLGGSFFCSRQGPVEQGDVKRSTDQSFHPECKKKSQGFQRSYTKDSEC